MRNVITITIEGLGAGLVGAYGSNTSVTPAIDRLAAHGILLDQCFLDSQNLASQLESLWTARHALQSPQPGHSLWQELKLRNVPARLLTDSPEAAKWAQQLGCESITLVEPPPNAEPEEDSAECAIMAVFAAAAEELSNGATGLVWIHSRGLQLPWDAPLSLRNQFTDPEDPDPPQEVGPPAFDVDESVDPDLVVGWGQVAAAQVALIDDALGSLAAMQETRGEAEAWSWCLIGLGGVPLGEHGRVGWGRSQLHGEELQCVAILHPRPSAPIGWRRAELCQLPDVAASVMDCCEIQVDALPVWGRSLLEWVPTDTPDRWPAPHQLAVLRSGRDLWVRSPAWSCVASELVIRELEDREPADIQQAKRERDEGTAGELTGSAAKLYVKPDDRWEVTEIANRRSDIVQQLRSHAAAFVVAAQQNNRQLLPVLDDQLCDLLR